MPQKVNPIDPGSDQAAEVKRQFDANVNMSAGSLGRWLESGESESVGQSRHGAESVGHDSGRRIVAILKKKRKGDLDADDYAHMKKVNGYIARHLKQRPHKSPDQLRETAWAWSLKNWGHDPLK